jgi:hypothetical protein
LAVVAAAVVEVELLAELTAQSSSTTLELLLALPTLLGTVLTYK